MKNTRRKHSDAFKTEVALEAIRERKTLSELAQEYQLAPAQISTWKAEFLSNAQMAFGFKRKKEDALDKQTDDLYNQIGRLKMENEWLKKKLKCDLLTSGVNGSIRVTPSSVWLISVGWLRCPEVASIIERKRPNPRLTRS